MKIRHKQNVCASLQVNNAYVLASTHSHTHAQTIESSAKLFRRSSSESETKTVTNCLNEAKEMEDFYYSSFVEGERFVTGKRSSCKKYFSSFAGNTTSTIFFLRRFDSAQPTEAHQILLTNFISPFPKCCRNFRS